MQFYNDTTIDNKNYMKKVHKLIKDEDIECGDVYRVPRKKKMYLSTDESMCVFVLRSKFHPNQGRWWIDVNHTQKEEMQNYKDGFFFFCLDGHGIIVVYFSDIEPFLTEENAVRGTREHGGLHWQFHFSEREISLNECVKSYR